ncbi:EthD domain-containing protein [Solimonas terrae]|uniref:EthD domain-containing protein n=1 Tax=Solimonas terrae TaxID=1396819 RepID=A0A6M2BNF8_9GAMM|nr:EthD domain-containing protein [Solimonas terrae]
MFKILIFLKRRPGMTTAAFREYYEGVHSKLGEKYSTGVKRYLRRYVEPLGGDLDSQAEALDFDVVTELWFDDRAVFEQVVKYAARGRLPAEVIEDEARLFDRSKSRYVTVVEHESALPPA